MRTRETILDSLKAGMSFIGKEDPYILEVLLDIRQILQETYLDKLAERAGLK